MIKNRYNNISLFQGLNALRFFAAFLVVMHHSETIRRKYGLDNIEWLGLFRNGGNAVTFFFVLSGFLITYLLLKERNNTGTVHVKKFYIKRILRIWPLYFLLVFIGTLFLPVVFRFLEINYEMPYTFHQVWFYFIFFLPGLVTFYFGNHFLEPLWSIGVEEVFYLVWAPLFKTFMRKILPVLLSIILFKILLILLSFYYLKNGLFDYLVNTFSIEAMAIGGLGAYFVFHRQSPLSALFIYKKPIQIIIYFLLALFLIFHGNIDNVFWNSIFNVPVISGLLIDCLFLYLIIGVSLIDHSIIRLNNKILSYLGEISYGIYMYHMIIIFVIIHFLRAFLAELTPVLSSLFFYLVVTVSVIIVSSVSKIVFENYFLNMKARVDKKLNA